MLKFFGELVGVIVILCGLTLYTARSFPSEFSKQLPVVAVRLEPAKKQKPQALIVKVQPDDARPMKLTRLDFAFFVVQSFTTTGYGNYNDLLAENPGLKKAAILLMTCGGATWAWLIAIFVDLLGH